ncbi:MAG: hypothetical protein ACKVQR_08115 [Aquabacterium sp.]
MAHLHRPTFLERLTRQDRSVREQEPADMGTAFGLEQSLDQPETDPAAAAPSGPFAWLAHLLPSRRVN